MSRKSNRNLHGSILRHLCLQEAPPCHNPRQYPCDLYIHGPLSGGSWSRKPISPRSEWPLLACWVPYLATAMSDTDLSLRLPKDVTPQNSEHRGGLIGHCLVLSSYSWTPWSDGIMWPPKAGLSALSSE